MTLIMSIVIEMTTMTVPLIRGMTATPSSPPSTVIPPPSVTERPPWRHTFRRSPCRTSASTSGNIIAMTATWMQKIAQDWLVLELTGSATQVGITVACSSRPC